MKTKRTPEERELRMDQMDNVLYSVLAAAIVMYLLWKLWGWATGHHRTRVQKSYDFIVVGSSPSGCVVAKRLASQQHTVLLLEAGSDDRHHDMTYYGSYAYNLIRSKIDWSYTAKPDPLLDDRSLVAPFGKVLGGTSALDHGIYQRPKRTDLDSLKKLGVDNWSYDDCLKYFTRSENSKIDVADKYHSTSGEMPVGFASMRGPIGKLSADSAAACGVPLKLDSNNPNGAGVSPVQVMTDKKGMRCTPATAFIRPLLGKKNFTLRTEAHVTSIVWEGKKAVGVKWTDRAGKAHETRCTKEVILCAGTIGTPAILLRSGVGAAQDSKVVNPAVGKNLKDLLTVPMLYQTRRGVSFDTDNVHTFMNWVTYKMGGSGPILTYPVDTTMTCDSSIHGLKHSWNHKEDQAKPRLEKSSSCHGADHFVAFENRGGFKRLDFARRGISQNMGLFTEAMNINVTGAQRRQPSTAGEVSVDGDAVEATFSFVKDEKDLAAMVPIVRFARLVAQTRPLKDVLTQREGIDVALLECMTPAEAQDILYGRAAARMLRAKRWTEEEGAKLGKIQQEIDSEKYLVKYMKHHAQPFGNPVGTCSMAPLVDGSGNTIPAAVDPSTLTLNGAQSLRIADASILPVPFAVPGIATALMIGERVAEMVLKTH